MTRYLPKYITVTYPFPWRLFQLKGSRISGVYSLVISIQKNGQMLVHEFAPYVGEMAALWQSGGVRR